MCLRNDDTSKKFIGLGVSRKRGKGYEGIPNGKEERSGQGGSVTTITKYIYVAFTAYEKLSYLFFFLLTFTKVLWKVNHKALSPHTGGSGK